MKEVIIRVLRIEAFAIGGAAIGALLVDFRILGFASTFAAALFLVPAAVIAIFSQTDFAGKRLDSITKVFTILTALASFAVGFILSAAMGR